MSTYIDNNRKSWFVIDKELKNRETKPITTNKKTGLFKKPDKDMSNEMNEVSEYVLAVRNIFKKNIEGESS
tara:strand:+ start:1071 stop:1283 length:213 start_codon:yes stop_codon:yes gene_type:complete